MRHPIEHPTACEARRPHGGLPSPCAEPATPGILAKNPEVQPLHFPSVHPAEAGCRCRRPRRRPLRRRRQPASADRRRHSRNGPAAPAANGPGRVGRPCGTPESAPYEGPYPVLRILSTRVRTLCGGRRRHRGRHPESSPRAFGARSHTCGPDRPLSLDLRVRRTYAVVVLALHFDEGQTRVFAQEQQFHHLGGTALASAKRASPRSPETRFGCENGLQATLGPGKNA